VAIDFGDQLPPLPSVWARLLDAEHLTIRDLAERAGVNAANSDACPDFCGGTFSDGGPTCGIDTHLTDVLAELESRRWGRGKAGARKSKAP
jgi:hypothetical protein